MSIVFPFLRIPPYWSIIFPAAPPPPPEPFLPQVEATCAPRGSSYNMAARFPEDGSESGLESQSRGRENEKDSNGKLLT